MMPWAPVLLAGLLALAAHGEPGAAPATSRPLLLPHGSAQKGAGRCPPGRERGVPASRVFCLSDDSCPASEKCCRLGTMRICVQPALAGQGYCPRLCSARPAPCRVSCLDDTWCGPGEKCCRDDCRVRCMAAEPARPGVCPRQRAPPHAAPCAPRCADDRSCPAGRKCCFSGCGLECVRPVADAGLSRRMPSSGPETAGWSSTASATPGRPITGPQGPPAAEKPGVCPLALRGSLGPCPDPAPDSCREDGDCEDAQKCCSVGCRNACREPEEVRPGACPPRAAEGKAPECLGRTFCIRDSDCSGPGERCCWLSCGSVCVAAADASSPPPRLTSS